MSFPIFVRKYDYIHIYHKYCNMPSIFRTILANSCGQTFLVEQEETFVVQLSHFAIL